MLRNEGDHLGPGSLNGGLQFRPLKPVDFCQLKTAHQRLFPIDYEDSFFHSAVSHDDNIISAAATHRIGYHEELVGFITARTCLLHECNPTDRVLMKLNNACLDGQRVLYILTLGVLEGARQQGIGSALLRLILDEARIRHCLSAFLHVIDYNFTAMAFYRRSSFQEIALLHDFYYIGTGRQRMPSQTRYNAFLYALPLMPAPVKGIRGVFFARVRLPFRMLFGGITMWCSWLWKVVILQPTTSPKEHILDLEQGVVSADAAEMIFVAPLATAERPPRGLFNAPSEMEHLTAQHRA